MSLKTGTKIEKGDRMGTIDLEQFRIRLKSFVRIDSVNYPSTFDEFWKWKLETETGNEHILDGKHRRETYRRLCKTLPRWQTYRGVPGIRWREILEHSLTRMSDAYNQIRSYSLLEFSEVPDDPLKLIWHELGRVKEEGGNRNDYGYYYIVAICKPLIFLWGQTLAFDSRVRANIPPRYHISKSNSWSFEMWKRAMKRFQEDLRQEPEVVNSFKDVSRKRYGSDLIVPYGQFLDLYYWVWYDKVIVERA